MATRKSIVRVGNELIYYQPIDRANDSDMHMSSDQTYYEKIFVDHLI